MPSSFGRPTFRYGKPVPAFAVEQAKYEMRQGVLWQPCPTCGAKPGEGCVNLASGTTANDFHSKRQDGYED